MYSYGTMKLQASFPFGDGRKLFDSILKYSSGRTPSYYMHAWSAIIFEANIFMIRKALPKFTKILSHRNFEPYGIHTINSKLNWSEHTEKLPAK